MTPLSLASFFAIEEREYTHFTFDAAAAARARWIILAFAVGILAAALYALYQHRVPGAIVRAVIRAEAFTPDTAKTAAEIGCDRAVYRYELRHNVTLRRFLHPVEGGNEAKTDAENQTGHADQDQTAVKTAAPDEKSSETRYYLAEADRIRAELRYESRGYDLRAFILTAVLTAALAVLVIKLLPVFMTVIDKIMG